MKAEGGNLKPECVVAAPSPAPVVSQTIHTPSLKSQTQVSSLAVTIGIGEAWRKLAERSAERMTAATGLPAQVVSSAYMLPPAWNPSWAKCWLFDLVPEHIDRLLVFDADIYPVAQFTEWDTDAPLAVVRHIETRPVKTEKTLYGLPEYWNGGLFVIRRIYADELRTVATYGPRYGTWLEQTALNREFLYRDKTWLPGRCNHLLAPPGSAAPPDAALSAALGAIESGATNLHFSGYGGHAAKIHALYDQLDQLCPL